MFFSNRVQGPRHIGHRINRRAVMFSLFACLMILTNLVFAVPVTQAAESVNPTVEKFTIDSQDVLATRDVTLHIQATAHNGGNLAMMNIREWTVSQEKQDWEEMTPVPTQDTGWVPFKADYAWTLTSTPGLHYMVVAVKDDDGNISDYTKGSADYADLVKPGTTIASGKLVPYLVSYAKGTEVTAKIDVSAGKAYLLTWYPGNEQSPNHFTKTGSGEAYTFTAPMDGSYLFLVYADTAATFTLTLTPAGGPNILETVEVVTTPPPSGGTSVPNEPLMSKIGMAPQMTSLATPTGDTKPSVIPTVEKFTIADKDVLTSPDVMLHVQATAHNDGKLAKMFIREWAVGATTLPDPNDLTTMETQGWGVVRESGWIPFEADYAWTLSNHPGVHYMAVTVADNDGNESVYTKAAADYADLVMPGVKLGQYGLVPYLVSYAKDTPISVKLNVTSGTAYLFAWNPGNDQMPDHWGLTMGETIKFTAPMDGTYLFLVFASQAATYSLDIAPAGGPNILETVIVVNPTPVPTDPQSPITSEPLMSKIGMEPTTINALPPTEPGQTHTLYIPVVTTR